MPQRLLPRLSCMNRLAAKDLRSIVGKSSVLDRSEDAATSWMKMERTTTVSNNACKSCILLISSCFLFRRSHSFGNEDRKFSSCLINDSNNPKHLFWLKYNHKKKQEINKIEKKIENRIEK